MDVGLGITRVRSSTVESLEPTSQSVGWLNGLMHQIRYLVGTLGIVDGLRLPTVQFFYHLMSVVRPA